TFGWVNPRRCAAASCVSPSRRIARMISITRSDFTLSLSAFGSPRSAKTLSEPRRTSTPAMTSFFMRRISFSPRIHLGNLQAGAYQRHVLVRRLHATPALLLEHMQNEDRCLEPHGIDRPERAAGFVLDDLEDPRSCEAPQNLRRLVSLPLLRAPECVPEEMADRLGHRHQVAIAAAKPDQGLLGRRQFRVGHYTSSGMGRRTRPASQ